MTPAGHHHGKIALRIGSGLLQHVEANGLGTAFAAETGFRLDAETVRAPDAAFVTRERARAVTGIRGFWPGAPDLAVEVVSPEDRFEEVSEKVRDWLDAGTRMVVVVDPRGRTATVYRSLREVAVLTEDEAIDGGDVVPGWRQPVGDLFR